MSGTRLRLETFIIPFGSDLIVIKPRRRRLHNPLITTGTSLDPVKLALQAVSIGISLPHGGRRAHRDATTRSASEALGSMANESVVAVIIDAGIVVGLAAHIAISRVGAANTIETVSAAHFVDTIPEGHSASQASWCTPRERTQHTPYSFEEPTVLGNDCVLCTRVRMS